MKRPVNHVPLSHPTVLLNKREGKRLLFCVAIFFCNNAMFCIFWGKAALLLIPLAEFAGIQDKSYNISAET